MILDYELKIKKISKTIKLLQLMPKDITEEEQTLLDDLKKDLSRCIKVLEDEIIEEDATE